LRGLDILVMIFVNDVVGVAAAPWWMRHFPPEQSGMTFVDWVFPGFLFIVGMVIPIALKRRMDRGESDWKIAVHVLIRTLGLLIVGVFMVNMPANAEATGMLSHVWTLLVYLGVILVWNQTPRQSETARRIWMILRAAGIVALVVLAYLYRGKSDGQIVGMRTQWWGILGLIGWAYLVGCLCYVVLRGNLAALMGAMAILYCLFAGDRAGLFSSWGWLRQEVDFGSMLGSHGAIVVSGVILGRLLMPDSPANSHAARLRWAILFGLGMAAAGVLLQPIWGINKNAATPSWCLYCSAITCWIWALLYWLMDMRGWVGWSRVVRPAGENPLMAYILAPIFYALLKFLPTNFYGELGQAGFWPGFLRSLVFAFFIVWVTGLLKRVGIWLKL
ncbi:MAG: DUF5009 domain-containing protein, partial [bacterium]